MSSGEVRRVSRQDIQLVQNLIERCLQLYMNQKEVVDTLLVQARIEPGFTELVHQNPRYVEEQRVTRSRLDDMHHSVDPSSALRNGRPSMLRSTHTADNASAHDGSMDLSVNMLLTQNSEMGMLQAMNGMAIKSEPGYSNSSSFVYGATDGNVLETHSTIGEASITSFSSTESNSQALNESSLDANFGFLRQIPRTFSLSDLTADFCQSSDIMENYSRSPFLDADDFPDSPGRECQGENKRLDTISESLSYEDFGSD